MPSWKEVPLRPSSTNNEPIEFDIAYRPLRLKIFFDICFLTYSACFSGLSFDKSKSSVSFFHSGTKSSGVIAFRSSPPYGAVLYTAAAMMPAFNRAWFSVYFLRANNASNSLKLSCPVSSSDKPRSNRATAHRSRSVTWRSARLGSHHPRLPTLPSDPSAKMLRMQLPQRLPRPAPYRDSASSR